MDRRGEPEWNCWDAVFWYGSFALFFLLILLEMLKEN